MSLAAEKLYFGSVAVSFKSQGGRSFQYLHGRTFDEGHDATLKKLSLDRANPASFLGPEYGNLILPVIPATDVVPSADGGGASSLLLPKLFQRPLIKSEEAGPDAVGVQSGRRSALLKTEGKWYRLKGCGDLYAGFPIRLVQDRTDECFEIRGCTFPHTATRELFMFGMINQLLQQHGMPISNVPLGWFEYDLPPGSPYPLVTRCCALYETKGEKRLGDHVIVGLERALPLLLQNRLDVPSLLARFEDLRKQSADSVVETWLCVLTDGEMGNFVDIYGHELDERAPGQLESGQLGASIPDELKEIWDEATAKLAQELAKKKDAGVGSLLAYLYWRFGREAGAFQRILRINDISWGTYVDPLGTHCNAHPNNFILLPEGESADYFLAPLDFDMAFTHRTFNREEAQYDEWMALEDRALKMALAGDENLSSGMTGVAVLDANFTILKWALRDTMVLGFISGFLGEEDIHPPIPALSGAAHALLKLALALTANEIA